MLTRIAAKASSLLVLFILFSIALKAQLSANFSATPTSQCVPAVIQFSDSSTGSPTQWKWDLGNGTTSFLQNPSAAYLTPGTYTIKLVIKNSTQSDSIVKTNFITVFALPAAQFTSTATTGCYPLPVSFTDQSSAGSGTVTKWQWDFGDGFTSTDQTPMHTYTNSGNFNVTLQVTNSNGCTNTISKTQYIKINAGVVASFTNSSMGTCKPPITINFQNTSTGTGTLNYQWSFGDGNSSSATNPTYSYNLSGDYTVKLIATNSTGCADTVVETNAIDIGSVHAAFTSADSTCIGNPILFTNTSAPAPSSVLWTFGDGTNSTSTSPSKTYTTPGTYQVKMVANFGACTDSALGSVTILPKPIVAFTANDSAFCQAPDTVNFTNQSIGGNTYQWSFGDGATSSLQNPSHNYTSPGIYDVTLTTTNSGGCSATLKKSAYIKIAPPKISFTGNLPDSGCAPFTKSFSSIITTADSVVSYLWDFGDGTTSTLAKPVHSYNNPGSYTISLTITTSKGCTTTATLPNGIVTSIQPIANLLADPLNTCAKTIINFTDESTLDSTHWLWSFGDGSTSAIQNPTHVYNDTGYYNVQLIAYNHGCPDTIKFLNYIHINPPIAKFSMVGSCDSPYLKVFTDKSIGADQWNWDFGDGTTSTIQSPTHTYANTGTYTVTLTVANDTFGCDFTTKQTLSVVVTKAVFFANDTIACKGSPVLFNAPIPDLADVTSYAWSFGDGTLGNTSTNNTTHTYNATGLYTVSLIITNVLGCKDTLVKPQYIQVNGPTAKFSVATPGYCLNSAVAFNDNSTTDGIHPIETWAWNYGDGTSDTLTTPPFQHLYKTTGTYPVTLTVTDSTGCSSTYKLPASLIISKPKAAFNSIDTLTCPNKSVIFTNSSTGTTLSYLWNFGDTDTASVATPTHAYSVDGAYTVQLTVSDKYGCTDSMIRPTYINVRTPIANFIMSDSQTTCPPLLVGFTNTSVNTDSVSWNFGDNTTSAINNPSHFYTYPGIYTVTLTVASPGGCISQLQKKVTIQGPTGTFAYDLINGCSPVNINFLATSQNTFSILWDFSDGTTLDTVGTKASHSYIHSGAYLPKMILSDSMGCHVAISGTDTIHVFKASAKFNFNAHPFCDSGAVSFIDSSTSNDIITGYDWNFGDGDTAISQSPSHQYTKPGSYYPVLTVTTKIGCINTEISPSPVQVVASPKAAIIATGNGCTPLDATFKGQMLAADTSAISWAWNFGNGNISSLQVPTQQIYSKAGVYTVQLKIVNSTGCFDTVNTSIEAYVTPTVNAGGDITICKGHGNTLNASGATSYAWSPATGLSCINCASPIANPSIQTEYYVTGSTIHGCSATDSADVAVKYPFAMRYSGPDTLCQGSSSRLSASGANSYAWTPEEGLDNPTSATPNARPDTTTMYRVIGTDDHSCFSDTGFVFIKVYPIPTVDAGPDRTINVGQSIDLIPTISSDVTSVIWSPTGAIARSAYPGITVQPTQTTQYTVEVKNNGGCTAHDDVTIYVVCNGGNVFVPNTFSPNGDGANDIFYPRGTGLFKIKTLRIFDRWGELVFENQNFNANDQSAGWNGTFKGAKLTPDVYVYIIDIVCENNSVLTFSGNVALIQ